MFRNKCFLHVILGLGLLMVLMGAGQADTEDWDAAALLRHMPAKLPIGIVLSSANIAIEQWEHLIESPMAQMVMEEERVSYQQLLDQAAGELGIGSVSSATELLKALHVDGTRPVGMAVGLSVSFDEVLLYLPIDDLDGFLQVAQIADSTPLDIVVAGEKVRAGLDAAEDLFWFYYQGYLVIGPELDTLQLGAASFNSARDLQFGTPAFAGFSSPGLFAHVQMDALAQLPDAPDMTSFAYLLEMFEAVVLSATSAADGQNPTTRLSALKRRPDTAGTPGPLSLPSLFPPTTIALTSWRIPPGLTAFVEMVLRDSMPPAQATQAAGALNLTAGVLGDEVAFGLLEANPVQPHVLLAARFKDPQLLLNMLALAGIAPGEPVAQHGGVDISEVDAGLGMFPAYYALLDNLLLAGADLEDVRDAIERVRSGSGGAGPLGKDVHERANQGVLYVDLAAILEMAENSPFGLPPDTDMEMLRALLGRDALTWVVENRPDAIQISIVGMDLLTPGAILLPGLTRAREAAKRSSSQNNLKQMGLVFKMYSNEQPSEKFPAYPPEPGRLAPDPAAIYPEYLTDTTILTSPGNDLPGALATVADDDPAALIDDHHYVYLAFAVLDEKTGADFVEAYKQLAAAGEGFDKDVKLDSGATVYRLREGVERFFIEGVESGPGASWQRQSEIILMFERPEMRKPAGGSVLLLDGHVEFRRMGTFPYTDAFLAGIAELDALGSGSTAGDDWLNLISNR
jgi:hypothetical protein